MAVAFAMSFFGAAFAAPLITACTTITQPGSYLLLNNLSAGGNCIVVAASFVTIDLNGFMINGKGGSGISEQPGSALRAITIRNGTITAFAQAILFPKSIAVVIERITATDNTGNAITAGDMATVRDSATHVNGGNGISLGLFSLVRGNASSENGGLGIFVECPSAVVSNAATNNLGQNIVLLGGACVSDHNSDL